MNIHTRDAYSMLARFIDPGSDAVFIDAGANIGDACERFKHEFPHASVHAFEPSPRVAARLRERAAGMQGVEAIEACLGDHDGVAELRLTSNDWCASTLAPSAEGKRLYPSYLDDAGAARVPLTTLDSWAARRGIHRIDAIKLDVQGGELAVLKGAERTLADRGVLAVYAEAQIVQLYDNAATFSEIDSFLRARGFHLHQIHTLSVRGPEEQASELDGLWLRTDVLDWLRAAADTDRAFEEGWRERMRRALAACRARNQRTAIYGVGRHTRALLDVLRDSGADLRGFIDDAHGAASPLNGLPVVPSARAAELGIDAVVLSSNSHEPRLWGTSEPLRAQGIEVVRLYDRPLTLAGASRGQEGACTQSSAKPHDSCRARTATHAASTHRPATPITPAAQIEPRAAFGAERFHEDFYTRLTNRRLEHLASLNLDLRGSVLELGAGIGDFTSFFADRGCDVITTDARPELVSRIAGRFAAYPNVRAAVLDVESSVSLSDSPGPGAAILPPNPARARHAFDLVVCYGLLYHLREPVKALDFMSAACRGALLLETCVSPGPGEHLNPVDEDAHDVTQSVTGRGCRPTRAWVLSKLLARFPHVYVPRTQPSHEEFPLDWSAPRPQGRLTRAVFVASCSPINNPMLLAELPTLQLAA